MPIVVALLPTAVWPQNTARITGGPTCAQCKLKTTQLAVLGKASDPHLLSIGSLALRDSRGWFYADASDPGKILVYRPDGGYASSLGRSGSGPGEFGGITTLTVDRGDTLHLFSDRESLFLRDGTFIRTRTIPQVTAVNAAIAYGGGTLLIQSNVVTRDRFGDPFHLIGPDGSVRRSFGLAANEQILESRISGRRRIADGGDGTFWSGRLNQYVLERWDTAGRLINSFIRVAPWFETWDPLTVGRADPRTSPPKPTLIGISLDGNLLWTLTRIASSKWKPVTGARGEAPVTASQFENVYDTVVECIDTRTGSLLLSERLPRTFGRFASPGAVVELVENPDGDISIKVWKLEVMR